jgi:hypothetical protein
MIHWSCAGKPALQNRPARILAMGGWGGWGLSPRTSSLADLVVATRLLCALITLALLMRGSPPLPPFATGGKGAPSGATLARRETARTGLPRRVI